MAWTCDACGTANPVAAAFCSMCKAVPRRASRSTASAAPSSGLALDVPSPPPPARLAQSGARHAAPFTLRPRALATGRFDHITLVQEGAVLVVRWGLSLGGVVRAVLAMGIGALLVAPVRLAPRAPGDGLLVDAVVWGLAALGLAIALAAVWRVGARVVHRFDNTHAVVDVDRSLFGLPIGSRRHALGAEPALHIDTRVTVGRYGQSHALHTLRLECGGASSVVAQSEDEIDLRTLSRDIGEHLRHGPR